jgi:protein ImuB
MLWAALNFPLLPLESHPPALSQSEPWAIAEGPHVMAHNACAGARGVRNGMKLSAASALVPDLVYRQRNRETETLALNQLATWASQFTPSVSLQPPAGLLLEIEGSLRLLGGVRQILSAIKRECTVMGYAVAVACAPTVMAAWLLARASSEKIVSARIAIRDAISPLPITALDCDQPALEALHAIGARTIGDVLALPRDGVARRFDAALLNQLDRALGAAPEARTFFAIPPRFEAAVEFAYDVANAEALLFSAKRLLTQLAGFLAARCGGIQRFRITLLHEGVAATVLEVGLAMPARELERFVILVRERFATVALPALVRQMRIEADEIYELAGNTLGLFPDAAATNSEGSRLIERLQARLGSEAVLGLASCAEHRPELAWKNTSPGAGSVRAEAPLRPLWLLAQPQPLPEISERPHYRDQALTMIAGPEIIETGWWNGDIKRDYFIAQSPQSSLYWIYRDRRPPYPWFLHGIFG